MALVLTRKEGEQLVIGKDITITIVEAGHGKAKISIEAPREIPVDRLEVRERKQSMEKLDATPAMS